MMMIICDMLYKYTSMCVYVSCCMTIDDKWMIMMIRFGYRKWPVLTFFSVVEKACVIIISIFWLILKYNFINDYYDSQFDNDDELFFFRFGYRYFSGIMIRIESMKENVCRIRGKYM